MQEMLLHYEPFDQWAHSMYFVFSVFTTVGFGDISAFTTGEIMSPIESAFSLEIVAFLLETSGILGVFPWFLS